MPPKFKIYDVKKFDGTGDPKQHIRRYLSITEIKGLDEKQTLHTFPLSLTGGASRWYYSLDPSKTKVWNKLLELFIDEFIFNTMIDVTLRDLETTKQGVGETFSNTWLDGRPRHLEWSIGQMRRTKSTWSSRTYFQLIIVSFFHRLLAYLENYVIVEQELKTLSTMDNWRKVEVTLNQERWK